MLLLLAQSTSTPTTARESPITARPPPVTHSGSPSINAPSVQSPSFPVQGAVEHLLVTEVPFQDHPSSLSTPASLPLGNTNTPRDTKFSPPFFLLQESASSKYGTRYKFSAPQRIVHTNDRPRGRNSEDSFSSTVVCPTSRKGH